MYKHVGDEKVKGLFKKVHCLLHLTGMHVHSTERWDGFLCGGTNTIFRWTESSFNSDMSKSNVWTWFSKVRWHTGWSWSATFNKELHFNHSCKNWCQFLDVKLCKFYTPHSKITNYSLVHTWFQMFIIFKCLLLKKWNADFKSSFSVWNDKILYQLLHLWHSKTEPCCLWRTGNKKCFSKKSLVMFQHLYTI